MNIDLRRLSRHNDGNIATEGIPKTNVSNSHPFKVVGRDSETQLQMSENLNSKT